LWGACSGTRTTLAVDAAAKQLRLIAYRAQLVGAVVVGEALVDQKTYIVDLHIADAVLVGGLAGRLGNGLGDAIGAAGAQGLGVDLGNDGGCEDETDC